MCWTLGWRSDIFYLIFSSSEAQEEALTSLFSQVVQLLLLCFPAPAVTVFATG